MTNPLMFQKHGYMPMRPQTRPMLSQGFIDMLRQRNEFQPSTSSVLVRGQQQQPMLSSMLGGLSNLFSRPNVQPIQRPKPALTPAFVNLLSTIRQRKEATMNPIYAKGLASQRKR